MAYRTPLLVEADAALIDAQLPDPLAAITFISVLPEYRALVAFDGGWLFSTIHPQMGVTSLEVSSRHAGIVVALRRGFEVSQWK